MKNHNYHSSQLCSRDNEDTEEWMICIVNGTEQQHVVEQLLWAYEMSTKWWDQIVMQTWNDQHWLQNAIFLELCAEFTLLLQSTETPKWELL